MPNNKQKHVNEFFFLSNWILLIKRYFGVYKYKPNDIRVQLRDYAFFFFQVVGNVLTLQCTH